MADVRVGGLDAPGSLFSDVHREVLRAVTNAADDLSQAIWLCDWAAEKVSRNHPSGEEFVTHYVVPHGFWAAVLREKQNLAYAISESIIKNLPSSGETRVIVLDGDIRGEEALRHLPKPERGDV